MDPTRPDILEAKLGLLYIYEFEQWLGSSVLDL